MQLFAKNFNISSIEIQFLGVVMDCKTFSLGTLLYFKKVKWYITSSSLVLFIAA